MPVSTRIRSGDLERTRYDPASLRHAAAQRTPIRRPWRQRTRQIPRRTPRQVEPEGRLLQSRFPEAESKPTRDDAREAMQTLALPPMGSSSDAFRNIDFVPPVVFGEFEEVGLSAIQRADRKIEQWEKLRAAHVEHYPAAVQMIDWRLEDARAERANLEDNEENNRIGDPEGRTRAVLEQIAVLEKGLETSQFEPERQNIQGAIDAYKSGEIEYSDQFTLIWAGKVVDRAPTYADFVRDRLERLDRYADQYGPHWLWWESPLNLPPQHKPKLKRCAPLPRDVTPLGLGHYWVNEAIMKQSEWVTRLPNTSSLVQPLAERTSPLGRVYCQEIGPKIVFRTMLDSGASFPTLTRQDIELLGVDLNNYGAQSITRCDTANGPIQGRLYELHVTVVDDKQNSLVDPNNAVWPMNGKWLGSLCPVWITEYSNAPDGALLYDEEGRLKNERLSGILPFLACYTSTTPTWNTFYLGEDRNDVMGAHKTPGQRRWEIGMTSEQILPDETKFGNPKITFSHRQGMIIDTDILEVDHASRLTVFPGTSNESTHYNIPGLRTEAEHQRKYQEAQNAFSNTMANLTNMRLE